MTIRIKALSLLDTAEVTKTVVEALKDNTLVIVTKAEPESANPVYGVYVVQYGKLEAGQIVEK